MLAIQEIDRLTIKDLPLVTLVTGEDLGQFEFLKQGLLAQIGFDASDLNYALYDMREADYAAVELDLVSLPFFADEKIIILDHFLDLTTAKKRTLSDEDLQKFEAYLNQPNETTRLIIFAYGKLDSKRRLVKLLKRDAKLLETLDMKEAELTKFFGQYAQSQALSISAGVLHQLLTKSQFDFAATVKNLALLKSYRGHQEVTTQDIEQVVPKSLQDNIFDLTQLVLSRRVDAARQLVRDLLLQGEDEVKLLAIMLSQFRLFLQVQLLAKSGMGEAQIVAELSNLVGRKLHPFQIKRALRDSRQLSIRFLKAANCLLIDCDFQIKSGTYDKSYLFDLVLIKLAL